MKKLLKINKEGISDQMKVFSKYPDITDHQAEMMLHALGADQKGYRSYNGSKTYNAYRNYYEAGGRDIALWEDLKEKGFAENGKPFYTVSVSGIHALEFLTQCRIWGNYQSVGDCREAVLQYFMEQDVFCGYGCWLPTTAKEVSLALAMPKKLVTDTIHRLWEEKYVAKGSFGGCTDEGFPYCHHGWYLADKAREEYSEKYKDLQKAEYKRIDDSLKNP